MYPCAEGYPDRIIQCWRAKINTDIYPQITQISTDEFVYPQITQITQMSCFGISGYQPIQRYAPTRQIPQHKKTKKNLR
ncbi:MAG: hypothetical protein WC952_08315, partial [Desulfobulbaceae bacterium]